jgi:hypothetical protein
VSAERVGGYALETRGIGYTIGGLFAGPIVGGGVSAPLTMLVVSILAPSPHVLPALLASILAGLVAGTLVGLPIALLVGFPVHLFMKRRGLVRLYHYMALGGLIALLPFAVISGSPLATSPDLNVQFGMAFGLAGAIGGLIFWLIRRPDRDVGPGSQAASPEDVGS